MAIDSSAAAGILSATVISRLVTLLLLAVAPLSVRAFDSVVVFNEIMYNPAQGDDLEWVEVYNQMAVDVELSNWSIQGVDYTFPTNTILGGGKYLVIASNTQLLKERSGMTNILGPFGSKLANEGETLRLRNHNNRIMDEVKYADVHPWPVGADGSGSTLAKVDPHSGSGESANWRLSHAQGGTPGAVNFTGPIAAGILLNEVSPTTASPFWLELVNLSGASIDLGGYVVESVGGVDAAYVLPAGTTIDGDGFLAIDQIQLGFRPRDGDRLFLFSLAKERLLDGTLVEAKLRGRAADRSMAWLIPNAPTPGEANTFLIPDSVVINEIMYHDRDLLPVPAEYEEQVLVPMVATWRYNISGSAPANWNALDFADDRWDSGPALLYVENTALPGPKNTELQLGPTSFYFRTEFTLEDAASATNLVLDHIIDDGAVIYLNGEEVYRFNMPPGPISSSTFAQPSVSDATLTSGVILPTNHLREGRNVIAAEVHQSVSNSSDIVFGGAFSLRRLVQPARDFSESTNHWIELHNTSTASVDLSNWMLDDLFVFPEGTEIAAGGFLVVAQDTNTFSVVYPSLPVVGNFTSKLSGRCELVVLRDATGNPVDEVRYYDDLPWPPAADGFGASLELRDPLSDNAKPESWSASENPGDWKTYTYSGVAQSDLGPTRWNEFIFGLLDAGEVLLDDFSVIENPGASQREILQNGDFENGVASWRFLGTHRQASVIDDPENPGNRILHLVADGPTEHMHNHVETTLVNNSPIANGRTYQISFRAKWIAGCPKLNTRLYFNRVAKTTDLQTAPPGGTPGRTNSTYVENAGPTFNSLRHSPIVPVQSAPVTVSVRATDPQGIRSIKLWSGISGTAWTSVDMVPDGTDRYKATLPGRSAGTTVQFYVEAEDKSGAVSFYPAEGRASRAIYKVADTQGVSARLHNLRILMLPSEATALHAATNVMSNGRSLCTVIYNDREVFYNMGLHLQSSQRGRMSDNRVGFTLQFPADHLFRGVHDSATVDRSGGWSGRGGSQDEIVLRHIINQAGGLPEMYNDLARVLTPLPTHTGTAMLLMAKHGSEYLDGIHSEMSDGTMFKIELVYYPLTTVGSDPENQKIPQPDDVTGQDIQNLGDEKEAYRWFLLAENHQDQDDYRRMVELAQAFSLSGSQLQTRTAELMDISQWARVFAVKSLSGDADTYGFGYPHNHMIFFDPIGKAITFPWDMDFAWTRNPSDSILTGYRIGDILNSYPVNRRLYLGHVRDIIAKSYNTAYISRWTSHYGSLAGQNYGGIQTYIGQRATAAQSQLPPLSPFAITSNNGQGFTTNEATVKLRGQAPYSVQRLEVAGHPEASFSWPDIQTYDLTLTLNAGVNNLQVIGYDFSDRPVSTNTITITAVLPETDADGDSLPDDWERAHGLDPAVPSGSDDADGDGLTNLQEFLAGTNPSDSASTLALAVEVGSAQIELSFVAQPNHRYRVQYRAGTGGTWQELLQVPPKIQAEVIRLNQTVSTLANTVWYRVLLAD